MNRPSMSTFMHHPNGGDALMVDEKGTIVKARDVQWIGVNSEHKSVYKAILETSETSIAKTKRNAAKGVSA